MIAETTIHLKDVFFLLMLPVVVFASLAFASWRKWF